MRYNGPRVCENKTALMLAVLFILAALFLTASCAVPKYDATTDSQVTNVQKEIDNQLAALIVAAKDQVYYTAVLATATKNNDKTTMASATTALADAAKKGSYAQNADFYPKVDADLYSLEMRLSTNNDQATNKEIHTLELIRSDIGGMRLQHQQHGNFNAGDLQQFRNGVAEEIKPVMDYVSLLNNQTTAKSSSASTPVPKASAN